jgi:methionyl-tRNA synthetase
MPPYYLTTPIYYVNDLPHIGHIFTTIVADTLARYRRMTGDDVRFLTGTDEHGQNIERAAAREGVTEQQLADKVVARYHELWKTFGISHDDFIRTTEPRHEQGVLALIRRIEAAGDLYLAKHEGWYCSPCELYYTEKELAAGQKCPVHGAAVEWKSEENVFFRLTRYQQPLLDWIDSHPEAIRPETRRNEVRSFVESGLRDLSVSRTGLDWGIPFPGYPGHTVYVWLDALANYITALGFGAEGAMAGVPDSGDARIAKSSNKGEGPSGTRAGADASDRRATSGVADAGVTAAEPSPLYRAFWNDSAVKGGNATRIHLMGKDILRFHAVYWPAFLLSAGLPLPTTVWAHGWWLRDAKKMSKSVGNVVRPDDLVARFGPDALRYYLLREMVFGQDANFSDEAFVDRYNSDLANDLGNTASRVVTVTRGAFGGRTPPVACNDNPLIPVARQVVADYREAMDALAFQDALRALWRLLAEANQYLVVREPWKMIKAEGATDALARILWNGLESVRIVATGLLPFMPTVARQVLAAVGTSTAVENLDAMEWGGTPTSAPLPELAPLFPRIDKEKFMSEIHSSAPGATAPAASAEASAPVSPAATPLAPAPAAVTSSEVSIDQFFATELKVGTVKFAERVPKSDKLIRLLVDLGEESARQLVAGIGKAYTPEELVGHQVVVVANLKPAKLMGVESRGMILAATDADGKPILVRPHAPGTANGTRVK